MNGCFGTDDLNVCSRQYDLVHPVYMFQAQDTSPCPMNQSLQEA